MPSVRSDTQLTTNYLLLILGLLFCQPSLLAQTATDEAPSSFEEEYKKSFHTRPKLDVKFDNRFSFIRDNDVKTFGLKVGLSFRRRFKVGLGLNQMLLDVDKTVQEGDTSLPVNMEYFYFSPYLEYVYHRSKRWEFSLSTQLGFGSASYQYRNAENEKVKLVESTILSYEPAMLIDYKIIRWFGIGTGVGYRLIYYKSPGIREKFSSPLYVIKLKVYLGEIYRTITGRELDIDE